LAGDEPLQPERASPHSTGNKLARLAWGVVQTLLFRPSPRNLHRWRNLLLRMFGARIDPTSRVYPRARIWAPWNLVMGRGACISDDVDVYCVATITLGEFSTVSQYCYLCAASHNFEDVSQPLTTAPIVIGRRAWLAADVFVAPGVTVGEGAVVGARSSVFNILPAWTVSYGNPARPQRKRRITPEDFGEADTRPESPRDQSQGG